MTTPSPELRALRLWHWRKALKARAKAAELEEKAEFFKTPRTPAKRENEKANFHIRAVQALNDCFEPNDNVEQDADHADDAPLPDNT